MMQGPWVLDDLGLTAPGREEPCVSAGSSPPDPAELVAALESTAEEYRAKRASLRIEGRWVQSRTLTGLPRLRDDDLHQLVSHQQSQFFRVGSSALLTAVAPGRNEDGLVRAVAVESRLVETVADAFELAGITVGEIHAVSADGRLLELMTPRTRELRRRQRLRANGLASGAALLAWCIAAATYAIDLSSDRVALETELAALAPTVDRLGRIETQVGSVGAVVGAVSESGRHPALPRLAAVAGLLPPDVHLHALVVERDGRVRLQAHTPDPIRLVRDLRASWDGPVGVEGDPEAVAGGVLVTVLLSGTS